MDYSFFNIFDSFDDAVIICREGRAVYANHAATALLGQTIADLDEDELFGAAANGDAACGSIGTVSGPCSFSAVPFNGHRLYKISPPRTRDELANLADSFSASLRAAAAQQRFASDIIRQYTGGIDESQFIDCMAIHERSSYRIAKDAENIAFLGSGGILPDFGRSFDASSVVKDTAGSLALLLPDHPIRLTGDTGAAAYICGDVTAFERIVLNLISNAVKYSPEGVPVVIAISVSGSRFRMTVQDNGPGIGKERLSSVFDTWRLPRPVSDPKAGIGLGLYVVRSLTESFGGVVLIDSKPGRGTRVTVDLPTGNDLRLNEDCLRYSKGDSRLLTDLSDVLPSNVYRPRYLD